MCTQTRIVATLLLLLLCTIYVRVRVVIAGLATDTLYNVIVCY